MSDPQTTQADDELSTDTCYVVALAAEFTPDQRLIVEIDGRSIGIFNLAGNYYALHNRCPHRGGPLCSGRIRPLITAVDGYQRDYTREGEILKCPWHQWEFDIKSGRALHDEKLRVKTYRIVQEGDEVVLYV